MKNKIVSLLVVVAVVGFSSFVLAQGGRIHEKLNVGSTAISSGTVKVGETLTTREGQKIDPNTYRISVGLNSEGEAQFLLTPFKVENMTLNKGLEGNAANKSSIEKVTQIITSAQVIKNTLVKGLASNIQGNFALEAMTPTETMLTFNSTQFSAHAVLGRSLDSKLIDLLPTAVVIENSAECGMECVEGNIKVTVRNDGNVAAKGKWNVVLLSPQLFVGTISDVPASGEVSISSTDKVKFNPARQENVTVEVHADFYNKDAVDSNDSNNSKAFTMKLK